MRRFFMLAAAAFSLAACNLDVVDPAAENPNPSDPTKETFNPNMKIDISTMTKTAAGTYYKDVTVGTGTLLSGNAVVTMSYLGLLKDGSWFAQAEDQTVVLGTLVGGLQDGMPGMRVGGERVIVVPSALGYGPVAYGGIPANSTLVFDVILKSVQ